MKLPDGPKGPRLLQQFQWITDPISYMEAARRRYGDIFITSAVLPSRPVVLVSHPRALKQILTNDTKEFTAPGELSQTIVPLFGNNSLLALSGKSHRRQRKLLMPPFHGERMRAYGQLICDITEKVINQKTIGKPFAIRSATQEISLQIIMEAVFGLHEGERSYQLKQLIFSLIDDARTPLTSAAFLVPFLQRDLGSWSPWGHFLRVRQQIDELLYAEINERREQADPERTDILSLLISARDEEGQPMTNQELRDELMTLLFTGHETTATAMAWSLYWVHKQPEVRDRLLKELDSLKESPEPTSIVLLPYLTAVCNETLRIYPVNILTIGRMVQSPVELMGYQLSPGTAVFGCIYLTHHRENLYPQSQQFKPERFLEKQFSFYEFLPFGGGARRCIGEALAQFEMKLVLATILSHYQLALADNRPEKPLHRGITLAPARGVKMVIQGKRRRQERLLTTTVQ